MTKQEILTELAKATPPASLAATVVAGVARSDWVFALGGILLLLQIFFLLWDKIWKRRVQK